MTRTYRDGHTAVWRAADARLGWWGPDGAARLVVATTDPAALPDKATWYLATNLPRPGSPRETESPHAAAELDEIVGIYGIRNWIEQGYKQVKDELGWADFQVRSDRAIRRHQTLVTCALSFCWEAWFAEPAPTPTTAQPPDTAAERGTKAFPPGTVAQTLRAVRAWLTQRPRYDAGGGPGRQHRRPPELQALITAVGTGRPLDLYQPLPP